MQVGPCLPLVHHCHHLSPTQAAGELQGSGWSGCWGPRPTASGPPRSHSACVRILRRDIEKLGFQQSFTIYDSADSERVVKDILKDFNMDDKAFPPRSVLAAISRAKDAMKSGPAYLQECEKMGDFRLTRIAKLYVEYERRLVEANARWISATTSSWTRCACSKSTRMCGATTRTSSGMSLARR
ncbi:MAG: UvrD-helicase domain-containing protein [Intestinimonas sp.]